MLLDPLCLLQAAMSILKQDYKENEMNLDEGLQLSMKILSKTLDTNKLTADKGKCYMHSIRSHNCVNCGDRNIQHQTDTACAPNGYSMRTKRIQPARGWCATVKRDCANCIHLILPLLRPRPPVFWEASHATPQQETLSQIQDQNQH